MKFVFPMTILTAICALVIVIGTSFQLRAEDIGGEAFGGADRDPANAGAIANAHKRTYPGGGDEEDLQVQGQLPEATLKTDARSMQKQVYKTIYNQEMKDDGREPVEE